MNGEKDFMDEKFDKITKLITLAVSFISLCISIIALCTNRNMYEVNKEKFNIDTKENLAISVGINNIEALELKYEEECDDIDFASYLLNVSICFVNNSNLPIYIERYYFSRNIPLEDGSYIPNLYLEIEEMDLPIYVEPQETKFVNCNFRIPIPEKVNTYILEKFNDGNLDIHKIAQYLFFEKNIDMIGNQVKIYVEKGDKVYKYNPTIPFDIAFCTTRGNYFSTEFYTGLYLPGLRYFDEKYKGLNFSIKYGKKDWRDIVYNFIKKYIPIVFLIDIILFIVFKNLRRRIERKVQIQENNDGE